jgi:hypothetical protein
MPISHDQILDVRSAFLHRIVFPRYNLHIGQLMPLVIVELVLGFQRQCVPGPYKLLDIGRCSENFSAADGSAFFEYALWVINSSGKVILSFSCSLRSGDRT